MTQDKKTIKTPTGDNHRQLGVKLFNFTWTLMKKKERTVDDIDKMIHAAHASRYHWGETPDHGPKELSIGEWQLARVYALLSRPESSLWHARRCLAICEEAKLSGWLLAFAHEAMARAYASGDNSIGFTEHYSTAKEMAETIDDKEDRELLISDLRLGPWFGFVDEAGAQDIRSDD